MALFIKDLEDKKQSLVGEKARLALIKEEVDKQSNVLAGQIEQDKQKVASLSQRQQGLIAAKQASLNIPKTVGSGGMGGCSSDLTNGKDPGFSPKVGFFTYGVPNRVGLNQYGAKGRADAGQNSDAILRAYYTFDGYQSMDATIKVNDGNGYDTGSVIWEGSLEDYVKRIYEMPSSWPLEALKAQVIAARSYVMAQTNNGTKSICANQNCQVFQVNPKEDGNWIAAVDATSRQVMTQGGSPIAAYFSSTHGGYVYSTADIGWSPRSYTKNAQDASGGIGGLADLQNLAYDKESPWFYCNWGSRSEYASTAWMKPSEVADIFNVIQLVRRDASTSDKVYQPDKPHPDGKEVWSPDKVKQELKARGGSPLDSVSDVSVGIDFGSGKTTTVSGGGVSVGAEEFKGWFNLRAPANIQIVGPLFNVEKR
jgi:peptidoglycan hydrolase-like amidase